MTREEIIKFINDNPTSYLATMDDGKPHVRGILIYRADEKGILWHTGASKDLHKQLMKNPHAEMCFFSSKDGIQIRVSGKMITVDDMDIKKEIVAKRQFLKPWIEERGYDFLVVYRLVKGIATIWTMKTNLDPKVYIDL